MKTVTATPSLVLPLGRMGENEYTKIKFDVSGWLAELPAATIGLYNQRPQDADAYPVDGITVENGIVTWTITSAELAQVGKGRCELVAIENNVVAKSAIFNTVIFDALDGSGDTPDPWDSWQQTFVQLKAEAVQAAQDAEEAVEHYPRIVNGIWQVWDVQTGAWVSTGVEARGEGVPDGGFQRQVLTKKTDADFDTEWTEANPTDRITTLDGTPLEGATVLEAIGIPEYVSNASQYSDYGLTESGWYIFARIAAKDGVTVTVGTTVTGAAGVKQSIGATYIDVAVRFGVAAESQCVTVNWGNYSETFVFKATDLAVRNLDYRTTFYVYDLAEFVTWQYALTTDATFVADKQYYTKDGDVYTLATVTAGEAVPENTYYNHSKIVISGMTRNITYRLDAIIDCPSEVILPAIDDDTHGCWFEFQLRHSGKYSMTLTPPEGVKIATEHTQAEDKGFNLIDLHYMNIDGVRMWRFMNTHSSIPT